MYKLVVKWIDKSVMETTVRDSVQLRKYINLMRGGVTFASITTPSGVEKDITLHFNQ
jgi:hypothetical protein